jgi:hypothetical protein
MAESVAESLDLVMRNPMGSPVAAVCHELETAMEELHTGVRIRAPTDWASHVSSKEPQGLLGGPHKLHPA